MKSGVAASRTGATAATTVAAPRESRAPAMPRTASPSPARPMSHADRTILRGGAVSSSRSCTISGPSARRSRENSGLPSRNSPWAAMWTSSAPSIASLTRSARASAPSRTIACGWRRRRAASSRPAWSRSGPATSTTCPSVRRGSRACSQAPVDGTTVNGRPAKDGSAAQGRPCSSPVGAMTSSLSPMCRRSGASRHWSRRRAAPESADSGSGPSPAARRRTAKRIRPVSRAASRRSRAGGGGPRRPRR